MKDVHGNPLTVYEHSLVDIWNSADMRTIRRAMVSGAKVEGCRKCWEVEERGGSSKRMEANDIFLMEGKSIRQLKSATERDSFHSHSLPRDYQLDLGNVCNLKCRTCFSQYSSRIAADPVHRFWEKVGFHGGKCSGGDGTASPKPSDIEDCLVRSRFPSKLPWYEDHDFLIGELLEHPEYITGLQIIGGEPMVARQLAPVIYHIASKGMPDRVALNLTTNGTIFDPSLFSKIAEFWKISFSISIDGIGEYFEYIRYPGKWADILKHLDKYAEMKNVRRYVLPTFHIYNALNITDVFRFCDDRKLRLIFNTLGSPRFLAASVLPPKARRVAIDRLRVYAGSTRVHAHRQMAETLARELEEKGDSIDLDLIRKFMLFTNDLDSSRQKRFKDLYGETISLMAEDGIEWTDETLHAQAKG
ncbi:hypothetical protein SKTS_32490 [Sulfurimicrobium lacus]|uniref:Radical SAM core domain-containing protein n=1 Tax=Sulfurimicrobium lacus TaxID=2715678 RepID=A0A6F8VEX2_9PROT|nr:hypothetical protein SKTS_32490 [Sulfurimicrobium lacus]